MSDEQLIETARTWARNIEMTPMHEQGGFFVALSDDDEARAAADALSTEHKAVTR
jgi:hypothetical protein